MRRPAFTVTANGSYAARLALDGATGGWFPERWTLDGPEPYAVPLPGSQPEEPDSEVQPLADGRVLIRRRVAERHTLSLLYPTGPGTGELPVGAVECARLSLLPPAPGGASAYGLVHAERATALWRLHGGAFGPERVVEVPGRCTGGAWLDRTGRLLALDRELDGRTKTVVVDLERGGETSPLLQITEDSNDRLLLADPYSGLLLVRSDAPGQDRLGWGVLGSARPVRFPECLRPAGAVLTPFATQPGQELTPEGCAVAFRVEGATGSWVGVWRPSGKQLQQFPAPAGWLVGAGLWTSGGELRLPFVTPYVRCGLARLRLPEAERGETRDTGGRGGAPSGAGGAAEPEPPAAPLLQGVPRPEQAPAGGPQPLLQVPRAAPEQAAPLLHEVPRPGLGQEQPLLQAPRPTPDQAPPAAPLLRKAPEPGSSGAGQAPPLLREAPQPVSQPAPRPETPPAASPPLPWPEASVAVPPQSPLLRETPQPVSPLLSRPDAPAAAPLLHEAPRPASPPLPRPEPGTAAPQQPVPLLQEVPRPMSPAPCPEPQVPPMRDVPRADATPQAGHPAHHEQTLPAAPPQPAPLLHEVPRPMPQVPSMHDVPRADATPQAGRPGPYEQVPPAASSQSAPLSQEVPRPAPCPEPQVPPMRDTLRADTPPQAGRPAHHEHAPPQDGPLLERPHEGLSPGVPQTGPQGPVSMPPADAPAPAERAEAPASVWTAVDPAGVSGLPGAAMPGAWSAAVSRPVPLQQAPLGREHRT
ncbi:hypothetical protein [Streptomyces roseoverticillatus]|uniref:hypothetical protein n=1 Tax=Streptomyces roseoverticillatus TaxID=66429 RepID=UPI001F473876|nr:hypothetical protein [Streptomyces roseoverticillatus]